MGPGRVAQAAEGGGAGGRSGEEDTATGEQRIHAASPVSSFLDAAREVGGARQVGQAAAADSLGRADGAQHGVGEDVGAERADQRRRRAATARARREGEDDIAVAHRVDRVDAAREAVVRHLRDLARLGLGQDRIGGDDRDRRRRAGGAARLEPRRQLAAPERAHRADELRAVGGARAGDDAAGARIDDVADRVDGDERGDGDAADLDRCRADAALHRPADAEQLADRGAGAGADVALGERIARRRFARGVAGGGIGADARVADPEIEQDRRRNDRHDERRRDAIDGRADRRADAALVEPAHHAARRVEAEGAAAGEHDRVHLVDRVDRIEQLGLARPGRRAAHVDAGDGAVAGDHDRAAGRPARVGEVADLEAGDRGQAERHRRRARRTRRRSSACGATPRRSGTACRRRSSRSPSGA